MALIPGTLPSDTCYGTPQDLLELFAQYLDIPAVALQSKVFFSTIAPTDTASIWVDTTTAVDPIIKLYVGGAWIDYIKNYTSQRTAVTIVGGDYVLISDTSDSGNIKKGLVSDIAALAVPAAGSITYPMLSTSATEANNVAKRVAKAFCVAQNGGTLQSGSFGFTSVTDGGTGLLQLNFNFTASTNAVAVATNHASGAMGGIERTGLTTGSVTFQSRNSGGNAQDCNISCIVLSE